MIYRQVVGITGAISGLPVRERSLGIPGLIQVIPSRLNYETRDGRWDKRSGGRISNEGFSNRGGGGGDLVLDQFLLPSETSK